MKQNKFMRLLNEFLDKLGDVEVVKYIDYYYRETYEGSLGWKVRETLTLSDLINSNITPITDIGQNWDGRDLIKFLEKYEKPFEVNVKYSDSYERYKQQNEEHKDEEQKKRNALVAMGMPFYNNYKMYYDIPFHHKSDFLR